MPLQTLGWVFGQSRIPCNVANLSGDGSEKLCYLAGHTVVVLDRQTRQQSFLQGHHNAISCMAATQDRALLLTSDAGDDSLLVSTDAV